MVSAKHKLLIAAVLTFALALFQAVITISPEWSLYFGAGETITSRVWLLYITGFAVAVIFVAFGFYALSGAGYIKRLPLLRAGLAAITAVFLLRGVFVFIEILTNAGILHSTVTFALREIISSAIAFIIGLLYYSGTIGNWSHMAGKTKDV